MTQFRQVCGAQLKSVLGRCERQASAKYGWRCWQHRAPTQADHEAARAKRMTENAAQEQRVDLTEARSRFVAAALSHGLDSPTTRRDFARFKGVLAGRHRDGKRLA